MRAASSSSTWQLRRRRRIEAELTALRRENAALRAENETLRRTAAPPTTVSAAPVEGKLQLKSSGGVLGQKWRSLSFAFEAGKGEMSYRAEGTAVPMATVHVVAAHAIADRPGKRPHRVDFAVAGAKKPLSVAAPSAEEALRWVASVHPAGAKDALVADLRREVASLRTAVAAATAKEQRHAKEQQRQEQQRRRQQEQQQRRLQRSDTAVARRKDKTAKAENRQELVAALVRKEKIYAVLTFFLEDLLQLLVSGYVALTTEGVDPVMAFSVGGSLVAAVLVMYRAYSMAAYALARSPQEKALRRLFKQLGGRKWRRQQNWRKDTRKTPLGEWHGVTVDGDGNVVALQLAQNRLEGDFDAWARRNLGKLPKLALCNVSGNPKLEGVSASVGALEARGDGVAGKSFIQAAEAEALRAAGLSLAELEAAGFSAAELTAAGFYKNCRFAKAEGDAFDDQGALYHIGTKGGTQPYANPYGAGSVLASMSSVGKSGSNPKRLTEHRHGSYVHNYTHDKPGQWVAVDLGASHRLVADHYALRHDNGGGQHLRSWIMEGSDDGRTWQPLREHANDESLGAGRSNMAVAAWALDGAAVGGRSFRHFRVRQTGKNANDSDALCCAGIELYGRLATSE
jgi:hypothetical protein